MHPWELSTQRALPQRGTDLDEVEGLRMLQYPDQREAPEHDMRCVARVASTGNRCRNGKAKGAEVCPSHGGNSLGTRERAEAKLVELQLKAAHAYEKAMETAELRQLDRFGNVRRIGPDHKLRIQAADSVLDRSGMGSKRGLDVDVDVSVHFMQLIAELDNA